MRLVVDGDAMTVEPEAVIVAGFTGRDREKVESHLEELESLGVPVPERVPSFYPVPPLLVVQDDRIVVWNRDTSGEAEIALMETERERLVTVASDHTDRMIETRDIHAAKLACPKVVAREAWRYREVADHWDALELRSWIDGDELYQEGTAAELLPPDEVMSLAQVRTRLRTLLLLAGTLPAIGGIRASPSFRAELADPVLGRSISVAYRVEVVYLPTGR